MSEVSPSAKANTQTLVGTHAGLSSRMSAVVESGSKSRFFLTFCFGEGGLLARPAWSSYSWEKTPGLRAACSSDRTPPWESESMLRCRLQADCGRRAEHTACGAEGRPVSDPGQLMPTLVTKSPGLAPAAPSRGPPASSPVSSASPVILTGYYSSRWKSQSRPTARSSTRLTSGLLPYPKFLTTSFHPWI